jgi:transglutaminase-like putative cysteine protease
MQIEKKEFYVLTAACFLAVLPHVSHLPSWMMVIVAMMLCWRNWMTYKGLEAPSTPLIYSMLALCLVAVYAAFGSISGRDQNVATIMLLVCLKMLESRSKRDFYLIIFLNFLLMLTNFLYWQDIAATIYMLFVLLLCVTVHVGVGIGVGAHSIPMSIRARMSVAARALAFGLPLSIMLFLVFPRLDGPIWGRTQVEGRARTGMSSTMQPGDVSKLSKSDETAFVVKFDGVTPDSAGLYWRAMTLGAYDGKTWTQLSSAKTYLDKPLPDIQYRGAALRYEVIIEPHDNHWVYVLDAPREVASEAFPYGVTLYDDMHVLSSAAIESTMAFTVTSYANFSLDKEKTPAEMAMFLTLPSARNERTIALAKAMRQKAGTPAEMVSETLQYFNKNQFFYTTEPPLMGENMVDDFMFVHRSGFCEHYASSFVVMMRAAGIPSRVVVGYLGGKYNAYSDYVTVKQSDAHAWAEVWIAGRGWQRVDPTAAVNPDRVKKSSSDSAFGNFAKRAGFSVGITNFSSYALERWQGVNMKWNRLFLAYAAGQQRSFMSSLSLSARLPYLGGGVVAITLMMFAFCYWRGSRTRPVPHDRLYNKFCKRMKNCGLPRLSYEAPTEYGNRICTNFAPETSLLIKRFLAIYVLRIYASVIEEKDMNEMKHLLRALRGARPLKKINEARA